MLHKITKKATNLRIKYGCLKSNIAFKNSNKKLKFICEIKNGEL